MLNPTKLTLFCGLLASMTGICFAQAESARYFHLDFVVKEVDAGKVTNTRHYWTTVATGEHGACSIRTGSKVPIPADANGSYTYLDVGVNIDCSRPEEVDGNLALGVSAEISSAAPSQNPPLVRQNKWNSKVIVPLNKPTMLFSSDDLTSKGQIQVELTATPVK